MMKILEEYIILTQHTCTALTKKNMGSHSKNFNKKTGGKDEIT